MGIKNEKLVGRWVAGLLGCCVIALLGCWIAGILGHSVTQSLSHPIDSIVCGIVDDEQHGDSLSDEIPLPPEQVWKSDAKNRCRELTDSEIDDLSFDGYDNKYGDIFDSWRDFVDDYRPYYSQLTCPQCGHRLLVVYSESSREYWESLCGRGGYFFICTHCKRLDDFECTVMN